MAKIRFALLASVSFAAMGLAWTAMSTSHSDTVRRPIAHAFAVAAGEVDGSLALPISAELVDPSDLMAVMAERELLRTRAYVPSQRVNAVAGTLAQNSHLTRNQARPLATKLIEADERMRRMVEARAVQAEAPELTDAQAAHVAGTATYEGAMIPPDPSEFDPAFEGAMVDWVKRADVRRFVTPPMEVPTDTESVTLHADTPLTEI